VSVPLFIDVLEEKLLYWHWF